MNFKITWPCIITDSLWIKPTDALNSNFYWYYYSTCFGQPFCPSSGVLSRTSAVVHFMQLWWPFATRSRMERKLLYEYILPFILIKDVHYSYTSLLFYLCITLVAFSTAECNRFSQNVIYKFLISWNMVSFVCDVIYWNTKLIYSK
jgi:hypothetical protein